MDLDPFEELRSLYELTSQETELQNCSNLSNESINFSNDANARSRNSVLPEQGTNRRR